MNPKIATIMTMIGVGLLGVGASLFTNPWTAHDTSDFWITGFNGDGVSYRFSSGETIDCSVTVRYGDESILITVKDPVGQVVYERTIQGGENFNVNSEREGIYSFSFLNLEDSSKTVYLTVEKQILYKGTVIGLLAFSVFLIFAGIYGNYQHNKRRMQGY